MVAKLGLLKQGTPEE